MTILAGTDANNERGAPYRPVHGTALHDRGVIAACRRADLVLVDGDPTVDIDAVRHVRGVWIGGIRVE